MKPTDWTAAVELLAACRAGGDPMPALPEQARPRDMAEAYALQDALHRRLTPDLGPLVGFKIGCTTPVMQAFIGVHHPCAGGIFASTVTRGSAALNHGDYHRLGLECEIAVELGEDLPASASPLDRERAAAAVRAVMPAVEIVDERFVDFRSVDPYSLIADDFFGAGAVLGEPLTAWRGLDLADVEGRVLVAGREVGRGHGRDVLGHPLEALVWLAGQRSARGEDLPAGTIVLLGSVVKTHWPEPGERVEILLEGLGRLVLGIH